MLFLMMLDDYSIKLITSHTAKRYIRHYHYSHGCVNNPSPCYGLYDKEILIGAALFATPVSEGVRSSIFGSDHVNRVKELHRFHILDITPKNTESWFLSRILKKLKIDRPDLWAVLSFSDTTYGHTGIIYQATNAYRIGETEGRSVYKDKYNRTHSTHLNGKYVSKAEAKKLGWRVVRAGKKYRYLWLLPDNRAHKKELIHMCRYDLIQQRFH